MARVLVVDDEKKLADLLAADLEDAGHEVTKANDGDAAIRILKAKRFDIVLSDLRLGATDGLAVLRAAKAADPNVAVVLLTAYATVRNAVGAMKEGAVDYLEKPVDFEKLQIVIARCLESSRLVEENRRLKEGMNAARAGNADLIRGKSPAMQKIFELAQKVAASEATVLLTGESGTGKEVMARAVHDWSPRRGHSLIAVNCAALAETLLESELFGHERGAFTDAHERKMGWFEVARRGTMFLDEIGEMKPSTQAKLLRVLEDRRFHRLGGSEIIEADVRIVAATNRDLQQEMVAGRFREDLFYRLNVFPLELPPLRQRMEDLEDLAHHFLRRTGYKGAGFEPGVMATLREYDWPGNLRELRNVIERAVILAGEDPIGLSQVYLPTRAPRRESSRLEAETGSLVENEERMIRQALLKAGGNKSKAARLLGITRRALYGRLERYGIDAGEPENEGADGEAEDRGA